MEPLSLEKQTKTQPPIKPHKTRRNIICCSVISLSVLLTIILILAILALTVFKPKHTVTTVNSVKLDGLHVSLDIPRLRVDLNLSLDLDLSVKNPNRVNFKFGNSSTLLFYREGLVGEATVPAGEIFAGETMEMESTLTILADRLLADSNVYSDVISGTLPLSTYTRIAGRVTVMKLFKHHLVSITSCDFLINIRNRTLANSDCKYRTKL